MNIKRIDISKLKPNPKNPRKITDAQLESLTQSIKDFPEMLELRPLIIDKKGVVIGGNMRLQAAVKLGLKTVPVIRAENLTAAQIKEFVIKDNIGFGIWDWEVLADWDSGKLQDWGLPAPYLGHSANQMSETELNEMEKFDTVGASSGLQRVVFIFNNPEHADEYLKNIEVDVKKFSNAWHVNLSSQSI